MQRAFWLDVVDAPGPSSPFVFMVGRIIPPARNFARVVSGFRFPCSRWANQRIGSGRHIHTILTVRHLSLMGMPPPLPDTSVPNPLIPTGWRHRWPVTLSATAAHPHSGFRPILPCHLSVARRSLYLQGALHNRSIITQLIVCLFAGLLDPHAATVQSLGYAR